MIALLAFLATAADSARAYYVSVAPAESLYVSDAGQGRAVVLIPGLFGAVYTYRHVQAALSDRGFRAVVVEPLGLGRSGKPRRADYSLTAQADRVARVIGALGLDSVVVVAHSVGASVGLRLAVRHPGLVRGLISLNGGPAERAATPGFRYAMRFVSWVKWLGGLKLVRGKLRDGLIEGSGDPSWVTDAVVEGYTVGAAEDLDGTLLAGIAMSGAKEPQKLVPQLPRILVPVRLLVGARAGKTGPPAKEVDQLVRGLPSLAVDTLSEVGLYIQEEQPGAVVEAVEAMNGV